MPSSEAAHAGGHGRGLLGLAIAVTAAKVRDNSLPRRDLCGGGGGRERRGSWNPAGPLIPCSEFPPFPGIILPAFRLDLPFPYDKSDHEGGLVDLSLILYWPKHSRSPKYCALLITEFPLKILAAFLFH